MCSGWASKQGVGGHYFLPLRAPHRLIKGGQQGIREVAGSRKTSFTGGTELPQSTLRAWAGNWALVNIGAETEPPSLQNHRKGKNGAQPSSACRIQEDLQNWFGKCKMNRRLFFFFLFKNKKILEGFTKKSGEYQQLRQISLCYLSELAHFCLFLFFLFI